MHEMWLFCLDKATHVDQRVWDDVPTPHANQAQIICNSMQTHILSGEWILNICKLVFLQHKQCCLNSLCVRSVPGAHYQQYGIMAVHLICCIIIYQPICSLFFQLITEKLCSLYGVFEMWDMDFFSADTNSRYFSSSHGEDESCTADLISPLLSAIAVK